MIPENIIGLGRREVELRNQSLAAIAADKVMSDHLHAVGAAMTAIMDHVKERPERAEHELIVKRLGIRLFNEVAGSRAKAMPSHLSSAAAAWRWRAISRHCRSASGPEPFEQLKVMLLQFRDPRSLCVRQEV